MTSRLGKGKPRNLFFYGVFIKNKGVVIVLQLLGERVKDFCTLYETSLKVQAGEFGPRVFASINPIKPV